GPARPGCGTPATNRLQGSRQPRPPQTGAAGCGPTAPVRRRAAARQVGWHRSWQYLVIRPADVVGEARGLATQLQQPRQRDVVFKGGAGTLDQRATQPEPGVNHVQRGRLPLAERQFLQAQVLAGVADAAVLQQVLL